MSVFHAAKVSNVSVIIPVHNEEDNIKATVNHVLEHLRQNGYSPTLILVDDGSTDNSLAVIRELTKTENAVKYLTFSRNFGKEAALIAGIQESGDAFELLCYMDGDGQHTAEDLVRLIQCAEQTDVDLVCGARIDRSYQTGLQRWMTRGFYAMFHLLTDFTIEEGVGDFNVLRPNVVHALRQLKEEHPFMKGLVSWIGFRRLIVPIEIKPRAAGIAKSSTRKMVKLAAGAFLSFSSWPLRVWSTIGMISALLAMVYLVFIVINRTVNGTDVPGYASTIVLLLGIGGLQLISVGILGEYIARIYEASKQRPRYIISERNI
jgi:glycosyltransferase involved in cell wall biosynthesis